MFVLDAIIMFVCLRTVCIQYGEICRCEAFRLLYTVKSDETITYMDVNSLYPSILRGSAERPFPTGRP